MTDIREGDKIIFDLERAREEVGGFVESIHDVREIEYMGKKAAVGKISHISDNQIHVTEEKCQNERYILRDHILDLYPGTCETHGSKIIWHDVEEIWFCPFCHEEEVGERDRIFNRIVNVVKND